MRCIFLFSVILLITLTSSLLQEAKAVERQHKPSTEKIWEKLTLADSIRRTNPIEFKKLISELTHDEQFLSPPQKHLYNLLHAYKLTYNGQYHKASQHFHNILGSDASFLIKFRANYTLISVSAAEGKWSEGLIFLKENIKNLPNIKNNEHQQASLLTTIVLYNQLKQYNLSLPYIALLSKKKLALTNSCMLQQLELEAKFYLKKLQYDDDSITHALVTCDKANYKIPANIIRSYQAQIHLAEKNTESALEILLPFLKEVESTHYPLLISEINNLIAKAYLQANNIQHSLYYAQQAQASNKDNSSITQAADTHLLLYKIAKIQQDYESSLAYYEQYTTLSEANQEENKAKFLAFQLAEHQAFEKEAKIKLLNEKNALLKAERTLEKTKIANIQLLIAILTVALALLVLGIGRLRNKYIQIKELAEYDSLTGIYNRRHFTHIAISALRYCKRAKQDLSLIMFDLDHFKSVNDRFGHACGDWALIEVTKTCQNIGRQNDIFARIGGEEFCIILPSCNIDEAMVRAETLRQTIENIVTEVSGHDFTLTASFGVTDVKRSGFLLNDLMVDADSSAYQSKHGGRNQVIKFEPETEKK